MCFTTILEPKLKIQSNPHKEWKNIYDLGLTEPDSSIQLLIDITFRLCQEML